MTLHSGNILYVIGQLYVLVLFARALLSWFPESPTSALNPLRRFVIVVTEPVLAPFRRLIPPIGMFDVSFIVAFLVVEVIVQGVLARL
ncbi:MAG: YggT family protein [Acidimicrobiales bacterium]